MQATALARWLALADSSHVELGDGGVAVVAYVVRAILAQELGGVVPAVVLQDVDHREWR
jgi:hypothetical protein